MIIWRKQNGICLTFEYSFTRDSITNSEKLCYFVNVFNVFFKDTKIMKSRIRHGNHEGMWIALSGSVVFCFWGSGLFRFNILPYLVPAFLQAKLMLKDQFGRNIYGILIACLLFISMECSLLVEINNIHIQCRKFLIIALTELYFFKTFSK